MDSVIIFGAQYLFVFVCLGLAVAWLRLGKQEKKQLVVATLFAGIVALVLSRIAAHVYFDPRPFVTQHVTPLIPHAPDNGFPSDHALLTMTLSVVTYFFSKKIAAAMFALTLLVGIARVMANVHSPLDIAGGWVIGAVGALAGFYLMRYAFMKYLKAHVAD